MNEALARAWIALVNATAGWSAAARARLARLLGDLLWLLVRPRRRITLANLRACFPQMTERERRAIGRRLFRNIARSTSFSSEAPRRGISTGSLKRCRPASNCASQAALLCRA